MSKNIEETIFDDHLPVNTLVILERMKEILDNNKTNSILSCRNDLSIRKLMWLLNTQTYGQLSVIDLEAEFLELNKHTFMEEIDNVE